MKAEFKARSWKTKPATTTKSKLWHQYFLKPTFRPRAKCPAVWRTHFPQRATFPHFSQALEQSAMSDISKDAQQVVLSVTSSYCSIGSPLYQWPILATTMCSSAFAPSPELTWTTSLFKHQSLWQDLINGIAFLCLSDIKTKWQQQSVWIWSFKPFFTFDLDLLTFS